MPADTLRLHPLRPAPVGELTVRSLRVAGHPLDVRFTASGDIEILTASPSLLLTTT